MILGIGCDIEERSRFSRLILHEGFLQRVLTAQECEIFQTLNQERAVEWLAGRYCAKEAVGKALGCGIGQDFSFQDLSILSGTHREPQCVAHDKLHARLTQLSARLHLSISHNPHSAMAFAVIEKIA